MDDQSYSMDVDDLFGDSEQVALPAMTAPPVKGLAKRLDELSASGCTQKIAWSKNGCVAYVTPDGHAVNLKVFSRDPDTGKWDLGRDTPLEIPRGHDDFQYVHLSWSHLGNDLAIMDAAGHVSIFSGAMALDRMSFMRADLSKPEAEMDAVVGLHWLAILPYEQKNHIVWSAAGKGTSWSFKNTSHTFQDAHHPMEGKASMIYLKRHGEVKLRYQQTDNSWHEVEAVLGPLVSTREAFTHAAFASNNDNTLLLAAHDVCGRLHLYRIETKWNITPPKAGQPQKPFEKPEMHVSEITIEDACYPTSSTVVNGDLSAGPETKIRIPAQLTHLDFLPRTPEKDDGTLPTIQAIFSTPPNIVSFDQTQPPPASYSILVRWEIHQIQQNQLHSSLDQVTSKKRGVSSISAREAFTLKKLPDIMTHALVLSFHSLWYSMLVAFSYSDGTIEFRKRSTMEAITPDYNTESVTSLSQAGFAFSVLEPGLNVALSPNHCMAACMHQDGTIKLRTMEYSYGSGSLTTDEEDPKHSAALAALVLQSSSAANQYFSSDDIFSIIGTLSEHRKRDFIHLMFQGLNVNIDCGVDDNTNNHLMLLGRSPFFVKTLSAQHLLGLQESVQRSLPSKIAWMILNIKYITQILTTIARMHGQIEKNPLRPEVVPQFVGICRWIMHFMVFMIDELFALAFALRPSESTPSQSPSKPFSRSELESKITEMNNPAILLLLSSFPRMMMKLWAQPLAWVIRTSFTYTNSSPTPEVRRIYAPLHQALSELPFDWRLFENLISETQVLVRQAYKRHNLNESQRNQVERELILGRVPDVLLDVARRVLGPSLFGLEGAQTGEGKPSGGMADKLDIARIMFFDTTWLGLTHSKTATQWHDTHVVDVCQKMVIRGTGSQTHPTAAAAGRNGARQRSDSIATNGGKEGPESGKKRRLRRCVRCGSYMEDVTQGMPGYANHHVSWLMGVAKHCVCGNSWMLSDGRPRAK